MKRDESRLGAARGRPATTGLVALLFAAGVQAQDLEPRSYSNVPVGLNFLVSAAAYSQGHVAFDPTMPIADAQFRSDSGVLAYARVLDLWGMSSKVDAVLPYISFSGSALVSGAMKERVVSGFGDPRLRLAVNFFGAPALSLKEFGAYRQDLIVGASLQVTAPAGQYDAGKLINLGSNRWSFKPELGFSKAWGSWVVELMPSVTFYTDNSNFNNGNTFAQAPLYAVQSHVVYSYPSGAWIALDATYYRGARTTLNGVQGNNLQENSRAGLTFALPLDRHHSLKFSAAQGTTTRNGTEANSVAVAWQYRWGEGF